MDDIITRQFNVHMAAELYSSRQIRHGFDVTLVVVEVVAVAVVGTIVFVFFCLLFFFVVVTMIIIIIVLVCFVLVFFLFGCAFIEPMAMSMVDGDVGFAVL